MTDDEATSLLEAIGYVVIRAADLEMVLAEYVIARQLLDNPPGGNEIDVLAAKGRARSAVTGKSGAALVECLDKVGASDIAETYDGLASERNHVIHGVWWGVLADGADVVKQPRKNQSGPDRRRWTTDALMGLARRCRDLEVSLQPAIIENGLPESFMLELNEPWPTDER